MCGQLELSENTKSSKTLNGRIRHAGVLKMGSQSDPQQPVPLSQPEAPETQPRLDPQDRQCSAVQQLSDHDLSGEALGSVRAV